MWLGKSISMNFFLECLERKRFANVSQRYAHSLFHIWNKKIKREKRHKKIFSPRDLIIPIARIEQKKKTIALYKTLSRAKFDNPRKHQTKREGEKGEKGAEKCLEKNKNLLESYNSRINRREKRKRGGTNNRDRDPKFTVERISFLEFRNKAAH